MTSLATMGANLHAITWSQHLLKREAYSNIVFSSEDQIQPHSKPGQHLRRLLAKNEDGHKSNESPSLIDRIQMKYEGSLSLQGSESIEEDFRVYETSLKSSLHIKEQDHVLSSVKSLPQKAFGNAEKTLAFSPLKGGGIAKSREKQRNKDKNADYICCYTCEKMVKKSFILKHLLFGKAQCTRCNVVFRNCFNFQDTIISIAQSQASCNHKLQYLHDPFNLLVARLTDDTSLDEPVQRHVCKEISSYIKKLDFVKQIQPWKSAILHCTEKLYQNSVNIINAITSNETRLPQDCVDRLQGCEILDKNNLNHNTLDTPCKNKESLAASDEEEGEVLLTQSYNLQHLEEIIEFQVAQDHIMPVIEPEKNSKKEASLRKQSSVRNKAKSKKRRRKKTPKFKLKIPKHTQTQLPRPPEEGIELEFVKTPEDGYYYVVRRAVEECPMCYTELCPSKFTINVVTFLMTTVCEGCGLTIYIVYDPPDGTTPSLSIVTQDLPQKPKLKRLGRKNSRRKNKTQKK